MDYPEVVLKLPEVLQPMPPRGSFEADAAVSLLIRVVKGDLHVLLVKRVESPSDPWSGQMALPGGKPESSDIGLAQTAIRETFEETNIDLQSRCRFLGTLGPFRSTQSPKMKVLVFAVLLEHEPSIELSGELERFEWISTKDLGGSKVAFQFNSQEFPAYIFGDNIVWGLTYRVLKKFADLLERLASTAVESTKN